ncbi:MAG: hypothetical protein RM049_07480 [Nostoc sp. DedQUE04]|uniref:hypothetical protein n=1 Tax=Nostoc sp. DedQUE04 TaxID=3075390 RepID=UPI002AD321AF|nr:hypothetical protein [Nostoc sp. DedQUE04]MDZ8135131.1 hypothetical protein [Nostoc sp. DedQUE04]
MPSATKELTVQELIQELLDFPVDAHICLTDAYGETYTIIGFEAGSDCVNIVIADDVDDDDSDDEG